MECRLSKIAWCLLGIILAAMVGGLPSAAQESQPPGSGAVAKAVGKVKSLSGNVIVVTTDAGQDMNVQLNDASRLLRTEPGQKDLKTAAAAQLQDIQPGDRLLARGSLMADGKSIVAATVIVMKAADVSAKQEQEREDWKAHGIGGLVSAIDPNVQFVTISMQAPSGSKHQGGRSIACPRSAESRQDRAYGAGNCLWEFPEHRRYGNFR
jgi:hypothetical protein